MRASFEGASRRDFLRRASLAGTLALLGLAPPAADAEPPPETTAIRLLESPILCIVPQYVAVELLRSEGFTDVQYVTTPRWNDALAAGEVDVSMLFAPPQIVRMDAGVPIVVLAGAHVGCVELFGRGDVRSTRDLRGKRVAVSELHSDQHVFTSMFVAHVGLDPRKDIDWAVHPFEDHARLFADGKVDALMTGPPFSLELRAKKIGRVLVNTATDKPWSQYFCCMVVAAKDFVRKHPIATKRVVRALLKGVDQCAREPERTARLLVNRGLAPYESALQMMKEIPYGRWRQYDAEDTMRFFALRLHEAGIVKSSPQKIIAQGTDWRFLRELRRELKG
jgi:NitT/TauT family transport system substrate-binding protein